MPEEGTDCSGYYFGGGYGAAGRRNGKGGYSKDCGNDGYCKEGTDFSGNCDSQSRADLEHRFCDMEARLAEMARFAEERFDEYQSVLEALQMKTNTLR